MFMEALFPDVSYKEATLWAEKLPVFNPDPTSKAGNWIAYCDRLNPFINQLKAHKRNYVILQKATPQFATDLMKSQENTIATMPPTVLQRLIGAKIYAAARVDPAQ